MKLSCKEMAINHLFSDNSEKQMCHLFRWTLLWFSSQYTLLNLTGFTGIKNWIGMFVIRNSPSN